MKKSIKSIGREKAMGISGQKIGAVVLGEGKVISESEPGPTIINQRSNQLMSSIIIQKIKDRITPWHLFSGIYVGSLICGILYKLIWGH